LLDFKAAYGEKDSTMQAKPENRIKLSDGRGLGTAEFGTPGDMVYNFLRTNHTGGESGKKGFSK
jgi:hypothetical protein